jgi:hypothetical protein
LSIMDLLSGKLALLDYEGTELRRRYPSAETYALLAGQLADVQSVNRVNVPAARAISVRGPSRWTGAAVGRVGGAGQLHRGGRAIADVRLDLAGGAGLRRRRASHAQAVELHDGHLTAQVSLTPLFIAAE